MTLKNGYPFFMSVDNLLNYWSDDMNKKILTSTLASILIAMTGFNTAQATPAGGIPTVDVSAWIAHLERLNELKRQIELQTGYRLGDFQFNTEYFKDISRHVNIDEVMREYGLKRSSEYNFDNDTARLFDELNENAARVASISDKTLKQAHNRFDSLKQLVNRLSSSSDPKDVLDLQARINGEQTFLANELVKVQLMEQQTRATQSIHEQKIRQMAIESAGEIRSYR